MLEDAELLRRYAWDGSEAAFAELVRRRVNLVYSVALRQVGGDAHLAQDVTQKVFADLARKAPGLVHRPVLTGWLCRGAQYAGSDVVRTERRRRAREMESQTTEDTMWTPTDEADWTKVRPLLDRALGELGERDRDAIALRFFEARSFADVGARLRLTEEAARKRVERALDKLAAVLARHGVTSTATALGVALAGHASVAAPAGLAGAVTSASLAAGAAGSGGLLAVWGLTSAGKIGLAAAGAAALLGTGAALYEARSARAAMAALAATRQEHAALQTQVRTLRADLASARARAQAAEDDNATLLAAIESARAGRTSVTGPSPADLVRQEIAARYKRGQELMRERRWEAALAELLWCFDEGMTRDRAYSGTRLSVLLREIAQIGQSYPPALAALRARREQARTRVLGSATAEGAAHEFSSLNRALGEEARTLEMYDRFPADDPRRRQLLLAGTYQLLVDARRYGDALQAVPYERMGAWFERESQPPDVTNERYPDTALKRHRRILVADAAKSLEVLVGAGQIAQASEFAARILAFDASADTRELLQKHAGRGGHPSLLEGVPAR